jgi:hypothetical protein
MGTNRSKELRPPAAARSIRLVPRLPVVHAPFELGIGLVPAPFCLDHSRALHFQTLHFRFHAGEKLIDLGS